ncbi:MAG: hypothetical protein Q7R62_01370 [bacterium]|nr:hypothetical protein [bacterium]
MNLDQPEILEDPRVLIEEIRVRIMAMGGNDSENPRIDGILTELNRGDKGRYKNPYDAVKDVQAILDSKQDYH